MRWFAGLVFSLGPLAGCVDYTLQLARPQLRLSAEDLRWDGVVVGTEEVETVTVSNEGLGDLLIEDLVLDEEPSFRLIRPEALRVGPSEQVALDVTYVPGWPGRHTSQLELVTNDPDRPTVTLALDGTAMEPRVDVEPARLGFGWVLPGEAATRTVRVVAGGTGRLDVQAVRFEDAATRNTFGLDFTELLPADVAVGSAFEFEVVFRPRRPGRFGGRITIDSNAVNPDEGFVELVGNGDVDLETNAPPEVRILEPTDGTQAFPGQSVPLEALTFDEEDDPDRLVTHLRVDGVLVDTRTPDAAGSVDFEAIVGPSDASVVEVTVVDSEGAVGVDTVVIDVLDPGERLTYVLSGGPDPSQPFVVDDDLRVEVDGEPVFVDDDGSWSLHQPVSFEAQRDSVIRLVATDQQFCTSAIDALVLHATVGGQQSLNPARCRSACPSDPCFDSGFDGPWPTTFLDQTYPIAVP